MTDQEIEYIDHGDQPVPGFFRRVPAEQVRNYLKRVGEHTQEWWAERVLMAEGDVERALKFGDRDGPTGRPYPSRDRRE